MRSLKVEKSIVDLGEDIRMTRISRRLTIDDMADRSGLTRKTIIKLEKGDPSISLSTLGTVLMIMGEEQRLAALLDQDRLPQSLRTQRPAEEVGAIVPDDGDIRPDPEEYEREARVGLDEPEM